MIGKFLLGTALGGVLGMGGLIISQIAITQAIDPPANINAPAVSDASAGPNVQSAAPDAALVRPQPSSEEVLTPEFQLSLAEPLQPELPAVGSSDGAKPEVEVNPPEAVEVEPAADLDIAESDLPPLSAEEEALLAAIAAGKAPQEALASVLDQPETASETGPDTAEKIPPQVVEEATAAVEKQTLSALEAFAQPFALTSDKPLFSVVLIDEGQDALERQALADLPLSISFAIDPSHPNAAAHAAIYRAAGREVILLLPENASPKALNAYIKNLPEAIVVMEETKKSFQSDRAKSEAIVPEVLSQGRGLLTWEDPKNLADQLAKREAIPSAVIFRILDDNNENAETIRRYLDRAAFKADQDGRVTVVGHARPETIKALIEWSIEGRSANVALAPLSATLTTRISVKP